MKKILSLTAALLTVCSFASAQIQDLASPDGKLVVSFKLTDTETPTYSVKYDGKDMLMDSPIGIMLDMGSKPTLQGLPQGREAGNGDFTKNLTLVSVKDNEAVADYSLDRIKVAHVNHKYVQRVITLQNASRQNIEFEFRVSDNDIAFRYNIPVGQQRKSTRVLFENSGFTFPDGTTTFLTDQSDAMIGWQRSKPSYEEGYTNDGPMSKKSGYGHGYTFPGLFHVGENGWVLLCETGVSSRYCGSRLGDCVNNTYKIEFPMPDENNGNGTVCPAVRLPGSTPWRTITVGSTLAPIVETTVMWDYVEPVYETTHKYKYGRGTWSWIVWQDASCNWDDQIKFIDLASAMNFEYILIDAGWDQNIGYDRMEQLIKYANSKNVDVFLWYSSSGNWNDITQSPINRMDNSVVRKKEMAWLEKVNCKGIKVDFWGGDKQETMQLYEEVLSDADDHGLMCIFHGCTMPRGWERMYPNYVGSEAVLASENLIFDQHFCDVEAQNTALHPFLRNSVASMEFGGCFMNRHIRRGNAGGNTRRTTDCHELATTVLFQNAIQNFALTPENLAGSGAEVKDYNAPGAPAPRICIDYLKEVPTTWDETVFIDGYPGKYIVLARRSGDRWYIAGNNATGGELRLDLDLPMLDKGDEFTLFSDELKTREPVRSSMKLKSKTFRITMADQGGFVAIKETR